MSIVDSISSITMDAPIATMFTFDWTTDVIVSVVELVIVFRDVGDEFVAAKSDINIVVGSNSIKFKLSYAAYYIIIIDTYMHMELYVFHLLLKFQLLLFYNCQFLRLGYSLKNS